MISSVTVGCCGVVTRVPARAENHAPVGLTQTCCQLQERVEDTNGVEYISDCSLLLQRLHQLAGELGNLCFVISIRGTVKPHIFWRSVALALSRLATLRRRLLWSAVATLASSC